MLWNAYTELDKKLTRLSLSKCLTLAEILAVCMLNIILVPFCVVGFVTKKVMGVDACVPHPCPHGLQHAPWSLLAASSLSVVWNASMAAA